MTLQCSGTWTLSIKGRIKFFVFSLFLNVNWCLKSKYGVAESYSDSTMSQCFEQQDHNQGLVRVGATIILTWFCSHEHNSLAWKHKSCLHTSISGLEVKILHWPIMLHTVFQYYHQYWLEYKFWFLMHSSS